MDRRLLLTGSLALAASPALAQSSPAPATDAPAAPAPAAPAAPATAPAMKMATPLTATDAAKAHMEGTASVGAMSLLVSRDAAAKVTDPALKQFVGFEIAEQETLADILKALKMPGATPLGTVKTPTDAELTGRLDPAGKAAVTALHAMAAGKAFERDYIKTQVEAHGRLLAMQEAYLAAPDNLDQTNVAKLARGSVTEHLALLADLEKKLG